MDLEDIYQNVERRDIEDTTGPRTLNYSKDEGKDETRRGSRRLVLMTVCLGIICVLLLVSIIAQHISNTAERESLTQKKLELETRVTSLSEKLETKSFKEDGMLISNKEMSWSDSRQYCRDRGADLVIINTEEKQKSISSLVKGRMWIGLSDIENEGNMKWVDNSTLKRGFWMKGEPNDAHGSEDCVEIMSSCTSTSLNNWNDLPCSEKRKGVCEK